MSTLTIVGLGPGPYDDLSLGALKAIHGARHLILRTERHPCVAPLLAELDPGRRVEVCDDLYEAHAEFSAVYAAIVARVLAALAEGDVVYAVPGHPWVGEATTPLLAAQVEAGGAHSLRLVGGQSFVAPAFAAAQVDLMDGSQVCDAMLLAQQHYPQFEPSLPLLVGQVYARWLASDLKLTLLAVYPADHPVAVIRAAGAPDQAVRRLVLEELDRSDDFDHLTSVYVAPIAQYGSFTALAEIVAHLRAPNGCPWDREQTLESLRKDLLDEAAEVLEAIDVEQNGEDNSAHIAEELGDLYLVATMLTQIASEEGRFQNADVMRGIVTKLIRRHPHVFGDVAVDGVERVLANWDAIKAQEKADKGQVADPFGSLPAALPALEKARKLQSKAVKLGLIDRRAVALADPALAAAVASQDGAPLDEVRLGALLWQLVALAHEQGLDAEDALRAYGVQFRQAMSQRLS